MSEKSDMTEFVERGFRFCEREMFARLLEIPESKELEWCVILWAGI
jgi:hypothetical protein